MTTTGITRTELRTAVLASDLSDEDKEFVLGLTMPPYRCPEIDSEDECHRYLVMHNILNRHVLAGLPIIDGQFFNDRKKIARFEVGWRTPLALVVTAIKQRIDEWQAEH